MTTIQLPIQLGVCVPFAGGSATKAANFGVKPRADGANGAGPCKIKRVDFSWWTAQGGAYSGPPGQNDNVSGFTDIFRILDAAFANNYKLIGMCGYTPPWARAAGVNTDKAFPADARDLANFIYLVGRECEARHAGVLVMRECWNEANQQPFVQTPNVVDYTALSATCFDASKTGFIVGRSDNGTRPVNNVQYMTCGTGGAPSAPKFRHAAWSNYIIAHTPTKFDHVGIHPYPGNFPLGPGGDASYDPWRNDIVSISAALHAANRDDAQIVGTEFGWKTPEVTTLQNATAWLDQSWTLWKGGSGSRSLGGTNYGTGPLIVFECDNTAPDNSTAFDDMQGFYGYGTGNGDGASKKVGGVPIYLNKYLSVAASGPPPPPPPGGAINFPGYTAFGAGLPTTADVDRAISQGRQGFRCGFIDWDTGDPNFSGNYTPVPKFDAIIRYMNSKNFGLILQPSLGATFGGKPPLDFGQGYNHSAAGPSGVVDVPVKLSQFIVSVGEYYDGQGGRPLVTQLEILNEVNHFRFDDGSHSGVSSTQKAGAYLEYLARIYPVLKAARPDLTIYSSGLGGHQDNASDRDAVLFTQDLVAATFTLAGHPYSIVTDTLFDAYNFHPYYYFGAITQTNRGWVGMVAAHDYLATHGLPNVKFVVTEAGYPISLTSGGVPDGVHTAGEAAKALTDMFNAWNLLPWGGAGGMPFCFFSELDTGSTVAKQKGFGLLTATGGRKDPLTSTFSALAATQNASPPPSVLSLSPTRGAPAGGTAITVAGTFFAGATVKIGANACTSVVVNAAGSSLTGVTPAGTGVAQLVVTTSRGSSVNVPYQYGTSPPPGGTPTVTLLTPPSGTFGGGTAVTIIGTHFDTVNAADLTSVLFGTTPVADITVNSSTSITTHAPPGTGQAHVTVRNPTGTSAISSADLFTFTSLPPTFSMVAVSTPDGTVYTDLTHPISCRQGSVLGIAWSAADDRGIASTWIEKVDGTFLANGQAGNGIYAAAYDTAALPVGMTLIHATGTDIDGQSPAAPSLPVTLNITSATAHGLFASVFYTIYTIPGGTASAPTVEILDVQPNPIPPGAQ